MKNKIKEKKQTDKKEKGNRRRRGEKGQNRK